MRGRTATAAFPTVNWCMLLLYHVLNVPLSFDVCVPFLKPISEFAFAFLVEANCCIHFNCFAAVGFHIFVCSHFATQLCAIRALPEH